MKEALAALLASKKSLASVAGVAASTLVMIAAKHGWLLDEKSAETLVMAILGIVAAYVLGQGAADLGKEKAKIEQAAQDLLSTAKQAPAEEEEEKQ